MPRATLVLLTSVVKFPLISGGAQIAGMVTGSAAAFKRLSENAA